LSRIEDELEASMIDVGHRVVEDWMGEPVETLADLLKPGLRAVCIGINPAPASVAAGHYYQGTLGQAFFRRLRSAELLSQGAGWEDDRAYDDGIGFTDIVKRPTGSGKDVRPDEYAYGRPLLESKLETAAAPLLIFTFKKSAEKLFGSFAGNGLIRNLTLGGARVFVMPGPYEAGATVAKRLAELRDLSGRPG
jgi:double-stranded uracil-DNA glycosylase